MQKGVATVAQLSGFDEIIDARMPAEFAEDHIPGAINLPVLDNDERIVVGTIYKQQSAFDARRLGGALVASAWVTLLSAVGIGLLIGADWALRLLPGS